MRKRQKEPAGLLSETSPPNSLNGLQWQRHATKELGSGVAQWLACWVPSSKAPGSKSGSAIPDPNQCESPVRPCHSTHTLWWKKRCKKRRGEGTRRMERELATWSKKIGLHGCRAKTTLIDHTDPHYASSPGAGRGPPSSVGRAQAPQPCWSWARWVWCCISWSSRAWIEPALSCRKGCAGKCILHVVSASLISHGSHVTFQCSAWPQSPPSPTNPNPMKDKISMFETET